MRSVRVAVAFLLVLAGCKRDLPVTGVAAGIPPLNELTGVRLGMRADELRRLRPAARIASYYGYTEELPHSHLGYEVPGSVQDGVGPPDGAHLESVTASDSLADSPEPFLQWKAKVREVTGVTGSAPTCYELHWPRATAWMAVWRRGGGELFVLGQPAIEQPRGELTPPGLRIAVVRRGRAVANASSRATKVDCRRIRGE